MLHRQSARTGHRAAIYDLFAAAPEFYSAAADGYLVRWHRADADFGRVVATVEGGKFMSLTQPSADCLVAGSLDGGVHWLYPDEPERNRHLAHHGRGTFTLLTAGPGVYSGGGDGRLTRWSVAAARTEISWQISHHSLRALALDPGGTRLAVGASDGHLTLLDHPGGRVLHRWEAHQPSVFTVAFSTDGSALFSGGRDAHLRRWDLSGPAPVATHAIAAHLATVNALAVHPGGEYLATASRDKTVKLWRTADLRLLKVLEVVRDRGHVSSVNTLRWLDDRTLLTAGDDRRILEWTLEA